jgi:hypothetical protein
LYQHITTAEHWNEVNAKRNKKGLAPVQPYAAPVSSSSVSSSAPACNQASDRAKLENAQKSLETVTQFLVTTGDSTLQKAVNTLKQLQDDVAYKKNGTIGGSPEEKSNAAKTLTSLVFELAQISAVLGLDPKSPITQAQIALQEVRDVLEPQGISKEVAPD